MAELTVAMPVLDLHLTFAHLPVLFCQASMETANHEHEHRRQSVASLVEGRPQLIAQRTAPFRAHDPQFGKQSTDLFRLCGPCSNEALTDPMQRQHACRSMALIGTNRIMGSATASQIASGSAASFLLVFT